MRIWCLRPVSGATRSQLNLPSARSNRHCVQNRVREGWPSGRTQSFTTTSLASSWPNGASITPSASATCPCTIAQYCFSTARLSHNCRNSRAAVSVLATHTTPLVSRSSRLIRCTGTSAPRYNRSRPARLDRSSPLVGWHTSPAGLLITSRSSSSCRISNRSVAIALRRPWLIIRRPHAKGTSHNVRRYLDRRACGVGHDL